jgi:hypothetical protein
LFLSFWCLIFLAQVVTPAAKAARGKKKKKRADGGHSNNETPSPSSSPVVPSPIARGDIAPVPIATTAASGASGAAGGGGLPGVAEDKKSSALTSIVYPALSGLLEAQLAGGVKVACFLFVSFLTSLPLGQERGGGAAEDCL